MIAGSKVCGGADAILTGRTIRAQTLSSYNQVKNPTSSIGIHGSQTWIHIKVDTCEFSQDKLYDKVVCLESEKQSLKDEIVYLKVQSMRNNLVFSNITESENETNEEAVEKLRVFVTEKMKVAKADKLLFKRVHIMGVTRQGINRSTVAKFHNFKERELVRKKERR